MDRAIATLSYVANNGHVDSKPARVLINLDGRNEWNDSDDDNGS